MGIRAGSVIAPGAVTITNNTFDGNANVVVNQGTATTDVVLAGNNAVDTVQLSGATEAQLLALADHIVDAVDNASYGSVVLKDGHVYLTANSFFAPGTTTPSLQRAVDTAQAGDTIHVGAGAYSGAATTAVDNLTVTAPAGATGLALTLGAGVLNITLLGASNIDVTGNGLANIIAGNAGINALDGGAGDEPRFTRPRSRSGLSSRMALAGRWPAATRCRTSRSFSTPVAVTCWWAMAASARPRPPPWPPRRRATPLSLP